MGNIPTPWPSPDILETLVRNSSGYFIYALYCCQQLDIVLVPHDTVSPFGALDQLYLQILLRVPAQYHSSLCDILFVIVNNQRHADIGVEGIDDLLGLEPGTVSLILRPLHSVFRIPSGNEGPPDVEVYHASFLDFLNKPERSSIFYVGSPQHHAKFACSILKTLAYTHQDVQKNRANLWFRWSLSVSGWWIDYVASLTPSVDFVPLVRLFNADFVFYDLIHPDVMEKFFVLAQNSVIQAIHPVPEDLVQRWEDYRFIQSYEHFQYLVANKLLAQRDRQSPQRIDAQVLAPSLHIICALQARMNGELNTILEALMALLSQSPHLIRILQARRLILPSNGSELPDFFRRELFQIRIVLDLSWDDIRACIRSLRPFITQRSDVFYTLLLCLPILCQELDSVYPEAVVSRDLAYGFIRLMHTRVAPSEHSHPVCSPALPSVPPSTPTSHCLFAYHSPSVFSSRTAGRNGGFRDGVKEGMKTGATQPAMKAVREEEEVNGGDEVSWDGDSMENSEPRCRVLSFRDEAPISALSGTPALQLSLAAIVGHVSPRPLLHRRFTEPASDVDDLDGGARRAEYGKLRC
ncbi:hypothetical protein B0H14DRAFT_3582793 [Mycena olivaceomarginata]|nr:hypothetical protein B0H14DRAFT_3582793 [Mycena olivaceomarginata]